MDAVVGTSADILAEVEPDGQLQGSVGAAGTLEGSIGSAASLAASIGTVPDISGRISPVGQLEAGCTITPSSVKFPIKPDIFDMNYGYVDNGTWKYEDPTQTYTDVYALKEGRVYFITLGGNVGTRFRAAFVDADPSKAHADIVGERIINVNNPKPYANVTYTPATDGYLVIGKDNVGKQGVKTYVYDAELAWE